MKRLVLALCLMAPPGFAGVAVVVDAKTTRTGDTWRFEVTIRHADTGWQHYADGWGVYAPDGTELGYRILLHPHVSEQPFTRSLSGVAVPAGTAEVAIRPHGSEHGWGDDYLLKLEE